MRTSANRRLSLAFPDTSSPSRLALQTCMPTALVRQLKKRGVAEAAAAAQQFDRQAAATYRRNPLNCFWLNLLCFMSVILLVVDGLH